uniref:Uncharacterized protein n=1 Tax=Chaetoceros debilis TaxID=122233 RepID=A0A7S3QI36_9STRA
MNMSNLPAKSQEQCGQLLERTDELKHREEHAQRRTGKAQSKQKDSLTEMFIVTIMAPKKSEGICSFLHDDNFVTSHAERFLLSTHGGECLQMTPTITTDWVGQMYPTGFLVIDNNLAYIEDEDELDQVVDDWNDAPENTEYCQDISNTSPKQNESELELALQMSMMDAYIDVVDSDDNHDMFDVPPCRPEPHLKQLVTSKSEGSDTNVSSNEGTRSLTSVFDLMNTLPNVEAIDDHIKQEEERENCRKTTIAETEQKIIDENGEPIKIPRRKATNIDYIINAAVDKHLTIHMLQRMGLSDGSCMSLKAEGYLPSPSPIVEEHGSEEVPTSNDIATESFCPACRGRSVIHICGKRATPIDYDAIAKAAKEKKELEEAEKKKLQQERRKAAEQRRKEKKQLQKKEEHMAEELRQKELRKEEEVKHHQERELEQEQDEEEDEERDLDRSNSDVTGGASDNADDSSNHHMQSPKMELHKEQNDQFNSKHPSSSMHHYSPSHYGSGDLPSYPLTSPRQHRNDHNLHSYHPPTSHISSHQEVTFGDSMFSNIPTLPSEPSSFMYQNHYDHNNNSGFPREHDKT